MSELRKNATLPYSLQHESKPQLLGWFSLYDGAANIVYTDPLKSLVVRSDLAWIKSQGGPEAAAELGQGCEP